MDPASVVQGYLDHEKKPPPLGPPYDPRYNPSVGSYEGGVSYERGTTDPASVILRWQAAFTVTIRQFDPKPSTQETLDLSGSLTTGLPRL